MCFIKKVRGVLDTEDRVSTKLNNVLALIKYEIDGISWVGYYWYDDKEDVLYLGSYQGKLACTSISLDKGVCGKSFREDRPILVKDVSKFKGHIACDSDSRSELVLPIHKDGKIIGVLDMDSYELARFKDESIGFYKEIIKEIEDIL